MNIRYILILTFALITITLSAQSQKVKIANEYYLAGEIEKAYDLYKELEKDRSAVPSIHSNYLQILIEKEDNRSVEKYLQKINKTFPNNIPFLIDELNFYQTTDQIEKKEKFLDQIEKTFSTNHYQLSMVAQMMVTKYLFDDALNFYAKSRALARQNHAYALDLATLHRLMNNKMEMTNEYLLYAEANPNNSSYIKNLFQNLLSEEEDQLYLEQTLIEKIQENPDSNLYIDLLIWLEVQRKNFYAAFVQAKALDKKNNQPGNQSMRIAKLAFDNKSWEDAIAIYEYVISNYSNSYNYATARSFLIKSKENNIKEKYPVDTLAIRNLVMEYQTLYDQLGPNPSTLESLKNKATLHAFYLNEMDTAVNLLNSIISNRRTPADLAAQSKLELGDIYILIDQPWESTLLYSQVEKSHKESQLGYEAKLRNAKLNYFTGNFSLAKSHLDILKLATTRTISNDAIALSMLISDNTIMDTTDQVMKEFASAEMLLFTNHKEEAKEKLNLLLEQNPGHSLTDEIYWLEAKIALSEGDYVLAIEKLDLIIDQFDYDILSDDAFFKKANIVEEYLKDKTQAQTLYQQFLVRYPGSRHAAEARLRFRKMRGDIKQ